MRRFLFCLLLLTSTGCGSDPTDPADTVVLDASGEVGFSSEVGSSSDMDSVDATNSLVDMSLPPCTTEPCPISIPSFPYRDTRDTSTSVNRFDTYPSCGSQDESGPEFAYVFQIAEAGTIVAGISDMSADIDIHLLGALDANSCLQRGDTGVSAHLEPGVYYLVADSFVGAGGNVGDGEYDLFVDFLPDSGPCALIGEEIDRIGADELLTMPATGRVVLEAHLLTEDEHQANVDSGMTNFPQGWPTSFTDRIVQHYAVTEAASGYSMDRMEPWAPCCEPSNEFGQGSSARPPAAAEAWYINMRWRSAPSRGERYLVINPNTGGAVVAAAGYENGPGDLSRIGGACEEIHDVLGTGHLSTLTFGVAVNQALPYGPIDCHP